jgi:hypothetical protein
MQVTKIELVVNPKTAEASALAFPPGSFMGSRPKQSTALEPGAEHCISRAAGRCTSVTIPANIKALD